MEPNEYISYLERRRQKLIDGEINCIPTPFPEFEDYYPGIEQKTYYCVTANTGIGKSQITSFLFLFSPVMYAYENPELIDLHIFFYALEETEEEITSRFVSYLLFVKYNKRISKKQLSSVTSPVSDDIMKIIRSEPIVEMLKFFNEHVEIICDHSECNPTGIYKTCKSFAKRHGKENFKMLKTEVMEGVYEEKKRLVGFTPDNPNSYWLVIVDHIGLVPNEKGMDDYDNIKMLSKDYFIELRNIYGFSPVVVAQQTFDEDEEKGRGTGEPTKSGIADCKAISRDFNIVFGLHSPHFFKKPSYKGYNINMLEDSFRALMMLKGRDGGEGKTLPLYFDGCSAFFKTMPSPDNMAKIKEIYEYIKNIKKKRNTKTG